MNKALKKSLITAAVFCLFSVILIVMSSAAESDYGFLPFDKELYYGRSKLAEMENGKAMVAAYDALTAGVEAGETEIMLNTKLSVDDIVVTCDEFQIICLAHRFDNPQQFWVNKYGYGFYSDQTVRHVSMTYNSLNTDEAKAEFNTAVEEFIADCGVNTSMSEYEIAKTLHDALADHITYTFSDNAYNAYGAIVEGQGVCEGYAESYQYLLYLMGIQAHEVTGDAGGDHAWNLVRLDGEYYYTDVTWDDNNDGSLLYAYFNTTTQQLLDEGRVFKDNGYELPSCTATEAHYYNNAGYGGRNFKGEPSAANAVTQLKYYGEARFYYNGTENYSLEAFEGWLGKNISQIGNSLGLNGFEYITANKEREFILKIPSVTVQPLPVTDVLPRLTEVIVDTELEIVSAGDAGNAVVCPTPDGETAFKTQDIENIINNGRVDVTANRGDNVGTGSKISIGDEEAEIAVKGDIDGDGVVTVFDAMLIKEALESENADEKFTSDRELQRFAGDIDGDSITDANDAGSILKHVTGNMLID